MSWLSGWSYRKAITIDHTKIDSDLTDFPVLVKLTTDNFDFSKAQSNGNDIRFTSDDGQTLLKYERERHDSSNSKAEYWVKIPSVSSSVDTIFYIYYGNDSAGDGADPSNVWDSNFVMVHHMKDDPDTSHVADSTANGNDGTKYAAGQPAETDGQIAKGQDFDGTDDYINCGLDGLSSPSTDITVEFWARPDAAAKTSIIIASDDEANRFNIHFPWSDNNIYWDFGDINDGGRLSLAFDSSWFGVLTHWAFTSSASGQSVYKSGALIASDSDYSTYTKGTDTLDIGELVAQSSYWDGLLDELRISNVARSATWIKASYYSGNDSLNTFDGEENGLSAGTNLLDGKLVIKNVYTSLLDGKTNICNHAIDLLDGKADINYHAINLLDGKARIKDIVSILLDGKTIIKDSAIDLLDGKAIVSNIATLLLDGKTTVNSSTGAIDLLDGKTTVKDSTIKLFDGKAHVILHAIDLLDGKVILSREILNTLDGKACIKDAAVNLLDGKTRIEKVAIDSLDGLVCIKDVATDLFDGKTLITTGKAYDLFDGKISIGRPPTVVLDGKVYIVVSKEKIRNFVLSMCLNNFAVSQYCGYDFDSIYGKMAAGKEGIYVLDSANDDDGSRIDSIVELPLTDLGISNLKRLRNVYIGYEANGSLKLKVLNDEGNEREYVLKNDGGLQQGGRIPIGRDGKGRYWQLRLENVEGCDFSLDTIEIIPIILRRKF